MQVEVLIFGAASFGAKTDRVTVEVSAAPTVREVLAALHAQHPALKFALPPPASGRPGGPASTVSLPAPVAQEALARRTVSQPAVRNMVDIVCRRRGAGA